MTSDTKPDKIVEDWYANPKRTVFLIDETRRPLYSTGDEIVFFTCISLSAIAACHILHSAASGRRRAGGTAQSQSFKSGDILHREFRIRYPYLFNLWIGAIEEAQSLHFLATTSQNQKTQSTVTKTKITALSTSQNLPTIIEGRELQAVVHVLLVAARDSGLGDSIADAVIDRSDQNGLGNRKRRLPPGTMEILGPERLDRGPAGSQAQLSCSTRFRLIADSDQGPFRDLLLLPDLYGNIRSKAPDVPRVAEALCQDRYLLLPVDVATVATVAARYTHHEHWDTTTAEMP